MRARVITTILTTVVLTAAACSSDGPSTPPSTPSSSAAPSSAPTPTATSTTPSSATPSSATPSSTTPTSPQPWPLSLAQTNFKSYIEPVNDAFNDYGQLGHHPAFTPLRRVCSRIAGTIATAARLLAAGQWSSTVRPKIDLLVAALAHDRGGWLSCANASTKEAAYRATRERHTSGVRSEQARIALGLPPVK